MSTQPVRLGIDLGSNSLGWALFALDGGGEPGSLMDGGVIVFPDGRNDKDKKPLNEGRRISRGQRRRIRAARWRRDQLRDRLKALDLLPEAANEDPYKLRTAAPARKLTGAELARVLLHIGRHRGFDSNAIETVSAEGRNELKSWEERDRDLRAAMAAGNHSAVGSLLHAQITHGKAVRARRGRADVIPPTRALIREEFAAIRRAQIGFGWFDETIWDGFTSLVLEQRPLRPPVAGLCQFEWQAGERRVHAALPSAALFRIRQDLCHLRLNGHDENGEVIEDAPLTAEQFAAAEAALVSHDGRKWDQLRKALGLADTVTFNMETQRGQARKSLRGDPAGSDLAAKTAFGKSWAGIALAQRDEVVGFLLEHRRDRDTIRARATGATSEGGWGLSPAAAERCIAIARSLPTSRAKLGPTAIDRILPHLVAGASYADACARAGYDHSESGSPRGGLRRRLPYYGEALPGSTINGTLRPDDLVERRYGRVSNITVHVALNQLRRLINAVIEVHGRPTQIAIELLRDVKMGTDDRMAHINQTRKNETENARLDGEIMDALGAIPVGRGEARRRWRLWKEQEERCIYTGRNISASDLFNTCDIDHIVPRSRGGLERGDNEVVCLATVNRRKGDRTPYEAFHLNTDPEVDWDQLTARVQRLYQHNLSKRRRFGEKASQIAEDDGKGFLPRQFGDASTAARMALSYLRLVCPNVWATRGQLTYSLRRMWGLRKDRDEHANHFVDAAVIAMTDRARVNLYSRINALGRKPEEAERLPWPDFQKEIVNQADKLVPVMRPQRTPSGEMHNETLYSVWRRNEGGGYDRVRLPADGSPPPGAERPLWRRGSRQAITDLFPEKGFDDAAAKEAVDSIIDPGFRNRANRIAERDGIGLAEACRRHLGERSAGGVGPHTIECFYSQDTEDRPLTDFVSVQRGSGESAHRAVVRPDANHCLQIHEIDGRWVSTVVRVFDAANGRVPPPPQDARLIARLHRGDLIELDTDRGRELWRVRSLINDGRIRLWPAGLANGSSQEGRMHHGFKDRGGWELTGVDTLRRRRPLFLRVTVLGRLRGVRP